MRSFRLSLCCIGTLMLALCALASDKQSEPARSSNLHFSVVKDDNNKPVRNASVVLHPVEKDGKQAKGGIELKTDGEGKISADGMPYGPIRVQVLSPGFQTFGDDYQIDKPEMDIEIRLKRPTGQLSIYDKPKDKSQTAPTTPPTEPKPQ